MDECIICLKQYSEENPCTSEHVIPEFIGGSLEFDNVCNDCNSRMGGDFEGRLSNSLLFKLPGFIFGVKGKTGEKRHPFAGKHELNDGSFLKIHNNGKYELLSSIGMTPDSKNNQLFNIQVKMDEVNKEGINKFVRKKAKRIAKKNGIQFTEDSLTKSVESAIAETNFMTSVKKNPEIKIAESFNFSDIQLLYIKIVYELAYYQFGDTYIFDPVADKLRLSLVRLKVNNEVIGSMLDDDNEITRILFEDGYHWVHFDGNVCYVRLYSMVGVLLFSGSESRGFNTDNVYRFCYKTKTMEVFSYQKMLAGLVESGKLVL